MIKYVNMERYPPLARRGKKKGEKIELTFVFGSFFFCFFVLVFFCCLFFYGILLYLQIALSTE